MKDGFMNYVVSVVSFVCTLPVLNKGINSFMEAKTPLELVRGGCVVLTAFGMGYVTYKIIKDKDI